jgi:hypothetical protein
VCVFVKEREYKDLLHVLYDTLETVKKPIPTTAKTPESRLPGVGACGCGGVRVWVLRLL